MLVAVEEHDRHPIVELVHLVEVRDLVHVAKVDDREVWGESSAAVHAVCGMAGTHSSHARQSCRAVHLGEYLGVHALVWSDARNGVGGTYSRDHGHGRTGSPPGVPLRRGSPGQHAMLSASEGGRSNPWRRQSLCRWEEMRSGKKMEAIDWPRD